MSEDSKKVSNNDLRNSQLGGGFIDADTVYVGKNGGDIHNHYNYKYVGNPPPTLTRQEYRNRQALLTKVKNFWVKGVLEKSLYHQVLMELGLEERPDAITNPLSEIIEIGDDSPQSIPEGTKIIDIFDQIGIGRTLLILGNPGSGKTTTLLEIARDLIPRAEQDTNQLIPVVFNLSSWAKKRQTITDWLVEELANKYDVPKEIRETLVKKQRLLPLLDGLDEVKAEYRDDCIGTLNQFKQDYGAELVVCSRIKDYQALSNRLNFQKAVCIRLLSLEQVCHYLDSVGTDLTGLRTLIAEDTVLQELAQSPLMLNIMTLAYQGVAVEDLPIIEVVEERRKQLFDAYIEKMFKRRKTNKRYNNAQVKHWLIWLAKRMVQESQTVFLIERMQPNWLKKCIQESMYHAGFKLFFGMIFGLIGVLHFGTIVTNDLGVQISLVIPLVIASLASALSSVVLSSLTSRVIPKPIPWHISRFIPGFMSGLIYVIITVLMVESVVESVVVESLENLDTWRYPLLTLIIDGVAFGIFFSLIEREIGNIYTIDISWKKTKMYFSAGLICGSFYVLLRLLFTNRYNVEHLDQLFDILIRLLIFATLPGIIGLLDKEKQLEPTIIPNQGIWISAKKAGLFFIIFFPVGMFYGLSYFDKPHQIISIGLAAGLLAGMAGGLRPVFAGLVLIQHFSLRLILYFNKYIPWNYARFLDYATDRIFLQKVGGGYIFIHRMLMEHFAEMEPEN
ncbi:MAG: NACHT domain-containing protein [Moorea sp. SIO2I5]|nr:NACHT domain-containing protein [Moorena sp. SIO2I5]